tara:strand:- start:868 stop:1104 length:237 start_codon:yes stop_codon:yes gene_type:complete
MIANVLDLEVGDFIYTVGDLHLYSNHIEQAKTQILRTPYELPNLKIKRKAENIFTFKYSDFEILNYQSHPHISGSIAV